MGLAEIVTGSKHVARRLLMTGENRLKLLLLEVQEEREHLLHSILLAVSGAAFLLLAAVGLSGVFLVLMWDYSPILALLILTITHSLIAAYLFWRLFALQEDWKPFLASLDQLKKDRECLEKTLV